MRDLEREALVMSKEMVLSGSNVPNPSVSAILSFFIPGAGQIYNGKFLRGIFWLIVTPGIWLASAGFVGWLCHIIAAYTAYSYAKSLQ